MNTLIAYDSEFGNTRIIAEAIGKAITGNVRVIHASHVIVSELDNYDLLVIGAPTHGGRPSEGVGGMLHKIKLNTLEGINVAAFDTRIQSGWARLIGFAAPKIARQLKKMGGQLIIEPEGFFVLDTEGPLAIGEVERAADWGNEIAARMEETPVLA